MTTFYRSRRGCEFNVLVIAGRFEVFAMSLPWTESDRAAGWSLPAPYFYDSAIFEKERQHIFYKSWHLVAHVNELRNPGDFVTYNLLDQSVIVTRSKESGIQGFHNVCQHRGNRLLETPRGHT